MILAFSIGGVPAAAGEMPDKLNFPEAVPGSSESRIAERFVLEGQEPCLPHALPSTRAGSLAWAYPDHGTHLDEPSGKTSSAAGLDGLGLLTALAIDWAVQGTRAPRAGSDCVR